MTKSPVGTPRTGAWGANLKLGGVEHDLRAERKGPYGYQRDASAREAPLPTRTLNDCIDTLVEAPSGPGTLGMGGPGMGYGATGERRGGSVMKCFEQFEKFEVLSVPFRYPIFILTHRTHRRSLSYLSK